MPGRGFSLALLPVRPRGARLKPRPGVLVPRAGRPLASCADEAGPRHPPARRRQALRADHRGRRPRPRGPDGDVRRPARAERRRQVDDDAAAHGAVDRRRGRARGARLHGCPASRSRRAARCGVVPQLDNLDTTLTVEQNLLVFTHLYRVARAERPAAIERALELAKLVDRRDERVDKLSRRHAPAAADRTGARAPAAAGAARRADRRARPAGAPGAVGADRRAAQPRARRSSCRRTTSRRPSASRDTVTDHVPRQSGRAGPPAELVASTRARRRSRCTARPPGSPRWRRGARARGCAHAAPDTSVSVLGVDGRNGIASRGRAAPREPRGRVRAAHRRGDRVSATSERTCVAHRPARALRADRRARPRGRELLLVLEVDDVLVDGRADHLPARVRLRLRLARRARSAATTTSTSSERAPWRRRCCSPARSRRCSGRS